MHHPGPAKLVLEKTWRLQAVAASRLSRGANCASKASQTRYAAAAAPLMAPLLLLLLPLLDTRLLEAPLNRAPSSVLRLA